MIASMPVALMPFLQNRCVAALQQAPARGFVFAGTGVRRVGFFFDEVFDHELQLNRSRASISKPHLFRAEKIRKGKAQLHRL